MLLTYGFQGTCGTNATLVHGIGNSADTLKLWLAYMIFLTAIDLPRIPLHTWSKRINAQPEPTSTTGQQFPLPQRYRLKKQLANVVSKILPVVYTILWILIVLWLMAGTVWLAATDCTVTNPQLFLFCFCNIVASWIIGVSWYTLSRWRSWHKQNVEMRARRESALRALGMIDIGNGVRVNIGDLGDSGLSLFGSRPDLFPPSEVMARRAMLAPNRRILYAHGPEGQRSFYSSDPMLDPILLSVINHAPRDFWAPVDPSMIRDPTGGGVKDEEWEKMRVFTFVKDVEGVHDANQQKTTVLDIEKSSQLPPLPANNHLPPIQSFDGCVICFCEFETGDVVRELQCRHAFHDECISKWMKGRKEGGQGKRTCPLCVSEVHV